MAGKAGDEILHTVVFSLENSTQEVESIDLLHPSPESCSSKNNTISVLVDYSTTVSALTRRMPVVMFARLLYRSLDSITGRKIIVQLRDPHRVYVISPAKREEHKRGE
jgi:hypothetical protein